MKEIWKDIPGYAGLYQASNFGKIRSKDRVTKNRHYYGKILKPQNNGYGYQKLILSAKGKHYQRYVHRLIAQTFIPNPHNYSEVNHKDENPANNNVDNLEWCTAKQNSNYGNHCIHVSQGSKKSTKQHIACINNGMKTAKPVIQLTMDGKVVKRWKSMEEAERKGNFHRCNIHQCCEGVYKQHKGYKWKYAD